MRIIEIKPDVAAEYSLITKPPVGEFPTIADPAFSSFP